jgi:hypothetical protein
MTDLEITKLCAEAMGIETFTSQGLIWYHVSFAVSTPYIPLQDDAQAMALVKRFRLTIIQGPPKPATATWHVELHSNCDSWNSDLNRAICECVAKMQQSKGTK